MFEGKATSLKEKRNASGELKLVSSLMLSSAPGIDFRDPALVALFSLLCEGATCHCCSRHP
jgi:hypothetical protein